MFKEHFGKFLQRTVFAWAVIGAPAISETQVYLTQTNQVIAGKEQRTNQQEEGKYSYLKITSYIKIPANADQNPQGPYVARKGNVLYPGLVISADNLPADAPKMVIVKSRHYVRDGSGRVFAAALGRWGLYNEPDPVYYGFDITSLQDGPHDIQPITYMNVAEAGGTLIVEQTISHPTNGDVIKVIQFEVPLLKTQAFLPHLTK